MRTIVSGLLLLAIGSCSLPVFGQEAAPAKSASIALPSLLKVLAKSGSPAAQLNILRGINAAMKGQRNVPAPPEWPALYATLSQSSNAELRQQAQALAVTFGGGAALEDLRQALGDTKLSLERRRAALDSLVGAKDAATLPLLIALLSEATPLRNPALHALANFDAAEIPPAILNTYPKLSSEEKRGALATLSLRPAWAAALLAAVEGKVVPRTEISAPLARQLQDLHEPAVDRWMAQNWGAVRTSSAEKQQEIVRFKSFLTPTSLQAADPTHGRALFAQTCAICHTLFGAGAKIGPELPGAFDDVDYLLQNILDPNAIIGKDYQQTVVELKDGQTVIGIIGGEDAATLSLKSLAGLLTLQRADIAKLTVLDVSLMPEGLLSGMKEQEVRDLFAYLGRHGQVPMLATPSNIGDFHNGSDLSRWQVSNPAAWTVSGREVVGRSQDGEGEFLTSDMALQEARFHGEFNLTGPAASAELLALDPEDPSVSELTIRLVPEGADAIDAAGGEAGRVILHRGPARVELTRRNGLLEVSFNGQPIQAPQGSAEAGMSRRGVVVSFRVHGAGSELRVRDLQAELLTAP